METQSTMIRTTWPRTKRKWHDSNLTWNRPKQRTNGFCIIYSVFIAAWMTSQKAQCTMCPPPETISGCPCYNFADGLFLECAGATEDSLKIVLTGVLNVAGGEGQFKNINKILLIFFLLLFLMSHYSILLNEINC